MIMYKLVKSLKDTIVRTTDGACIPEDPSNTDYQNFKYQINNDEAELQNVDGTLMSPEAAKAYVATLP
jgi:hypothetical protein